MYSKSEDWSGSCASMQFRSSKCSKCLFANEMESLGVEKCGSNIIGVLVMVCHYKNDVHWLLQMKTFESNEIRFRYFSPRRLASLSFYFSWFLCLAQRQTPNLIPSVWQHMAKFSSDYWTNFAQCGTSWKVNCFRLFDVQKGWNWQIR